MQRDQLRRRYFAKKGFARSYILSEKHIFFFLCRLKKQAIIIQAPENIFYNNLRNIHFSTEINTKSCMFNVIRLLQRKPFR